MSLNLQQAKAGLLANTRRKIRPDNLYDIATYIKILKEHYGGLKQVSEIATDISPNMLTRFLSVLNVDPKVVPLIKSRKIDNINVLYYIQTLKSADQVYLANLVAEGRINSIDVRAIAPLKKKFPQKSIQEIFETVLASKDKRRFLIKFDLGSKDVKAIEKSLKRYIEKQDFTIDFHGKIGTVILTEFGYKKLKQYCAENNISYQDLIKTIID